MVPFPVLQRDGEDVHDAVVEGFTACVGVHLLRIARPGADHVVSVMAGVQDDAVDRLEVGDPLAHAEGEVDDRLALILGRMLLGVGFEDRALGLARAR